MRSHELEWRREHARLAPEKCGPGGTDLTLVGAVDGSADERRRGVLPEGLGRPSHGKPTPPSRRARRHRWQYIVSGVTAAASANPRQHDHGEPGSPVSAGSGADHELTNAPTVAGVAFAQTASAKK